MSGWGWSLIQITLILALARGLWGLPSQVAYAQTPTHGAVSSPGEAVLAYTPHNLLRLHILANSNSALDQAVKMQVRDAILHHSQTWFTQARTAAEAQWLALVHREEIARWAQEAIWRTGLRYPVQVEVGLADFPERTYGDRVLPAGRYQAVRVILGRGQGNNWWCVLFPPLCLDEPLRPAEVRQQMDVVRAAGRTPGGSPVGVQATTPPTSRRVRIAWKWIPAGWWQSLRSWF